MTTLTILFWVVRLLLKLLGRAFSSKESVQVFFGWLVLVTLLLSPTFEYVPEVAAALFGAVNWSLVGWVAAPVLILDLVWTSLLQTRSLDQTPAPAVRVQINQLSGT